MHHRTVISFIVRGLFSMSGLTPWNLMVALPLQIRVWDENTGSSYHQDGGWVLSDKFRCVKRGFLNFIFLFR